jgi:acylphosphatase
VNTVVSLITISAIISGKVQGVFYRASTQKMARSLNITGWVRNTDNGAVELHATGTEAQIKLLIEWLWQGPDKAKVTDVTWCVIPTESYDAFSIIK